MTIGMVLLHHYIVIAGYLSIVSLYAVPCQHIHLSEFTATEEGLQHTFESISIPRAISPLPQKDFSVHVHTV